MSPCPPAGAHEDELAMISAVTGRCMCRKVTGESEPWRHEHKSPKIWCVGLPHFSVFNADQPWRIELKLWPCYSFRFGGFFLQRPTRVHFMYSMQTHALLPNIYRRHHCAHFHDFYNLSKSWTPDQEWCNFKQITWDTHSSSDKLS